MIVYRNTTIRLFKGIVIRKHLSDYKEIPIIEVSDSSGNNYSLHFYVNRDTINNTFWQSIAVSDTIIKAKEEMIYTIQKKDTTITLSWDCKENN